MYIDIFTLILSYLLGSISFGLISAKVFKLPDPRTFGSKNIGATNILRSGNKKAAVFTLLGDLCKGILAVLIARILYAYNLINIDIIYLSGLCVFIGHLFPVWLKFKGGKGVATAAGVLLAFNMYVGLLTILTWILTAVISKYSSLSAICAALIAPILTFYLVNNQSALLTVTIMSTLLLIKHYKNIINLLSGQESKIGKK